MHGFEHGAHAIPYHHGKNCVCEADFQHPNINNMLPYLKQILFSIKV